MLGILPPCRPVRHSIEDLFNYFGVYLETVLLFLGPICFLANSFTTTKAAAPPDKAASCTASASTPTKGATVRAEMNASTKVHTVLLRTSLYSLLIVYSHVSFQGVHHTFFLNVPSEFLD